MTKKPTNSGPVVGPEVNPHPDPNVKYLVLDFTCHWPEDMNKPKGEINSTTRTRVYLLPAHKAFHGFGGSRSGLVTGKTPSCIVRENHSSGMQRDVEYDLADPETWVWLRRGIAHALTVNGDFTVETADLGQIRPKV